MSGAVIQRYPLLLWFSGGVAALGGFLFGFDMAVVSGILPLVTEQFNLNSMMQGWFVSSALLGCIIGVIGSGSLADKYGRKPMIQWTATLFIISTLGTALCRDLSIILIFRIIGGIGVGLASSIVPLYISEIAPARMRGRMVTYYQLAVTIGILIAYLSNAQLLQLPAASEATAKTGWFFYLFHQEVWRAMFLVGGVPALVFLIGTRFIPESPRWLLSKGRTSDRFGQASELLSPEMKIDDEGAKSKPLMFFRSVRSKKLRRAFLLGILLPLFSQFCGINAIIYYGPIILQEAGMSLTRSLDSQILLGLVNMLCTFIAVGTVDRLGRRPLYLWGAGTAGISLFLLGCCFFWDMESSFVMLALVFVFLASFAFSLGPLKFVVASEIFPAAIRGRAMALSVTVMWVADLIVGQLTPTLLDKWGVATTFWGFASFCGLAFLAVYRLLPETKGLTLEQIEREWK